MRTPQAAIVGFSDADASPIPAVLWGDVEIQALNWNADDALSRSEAGVPLPAGGTVHNWIEALELRIARLAVWRAFDRP